MDCSITSFVRRSVWLALLSCSIVSSYADGIPLQEAKVHKVIKDVWVVDTSRGGSRAAVLDDVIKGSLAVRTGVQSRAELLFQDETLTRLGAESFFTFTPGTRDITLDKGTMLLQVPKGHGGAKISTAAVTAAITGTTIMIEYRPGRMVKVLVLEGSLRLSNNHGGDHVILTPGKMIIMGTADQRLPKPVNVDLQKIVNTSSLIDPAKFQGASKTKVAPLPSLPLIKQAVGLQESMKRSGRLAETKLVINGGGSDVLVAPKPALDALRDQPAVAGDVLATVARRERATTPVAKESKGGAGASGITAPLVVNSTSLRGAANNSHNNFDSNSTGKTDNSGSAGHSSTGGKGKGGKDGGRDNQSKDDNKDAGQGKGKAKD